MAQKVKSLPAMQETWVRSVDWEDPLEKGMATHSSILAWRTPWAEKPVGLNPWGCRKLDKSDRLNNNSVSGAGSSFSAGYSS